MSRPSPLREGLRRDIDPADPVTTKLMQSLQLAAWAKKHSPDRAEALAYERQCFEYLIQWLGQLERPDGRGGLSDRSFNFWIDPNGP